MTAMTGLADASLAAPSHVPKVVAPQLVVLTHAVSLGADYALLPLLVNACLSFTNRESQLSSPRGWQLSLL